jgi:hypothetical protein
VPADAAPAVCAVQGAHVTSPDGWTRIAGPAFDTGGDTMTLYTVDEMRPDRLFATNGVGVASSYNAGCTWTNAKLPADELSALTPLGGESGELGQRRLIDVQVPFVPSSAVWALGLTDVVVGGTPLVQPRVLLSVDSGRTFALTPGNNNLPPFSRPVALRTGLSPLEAYVLLDNTVPTEQRQMWVTHNGGGSFEQVGGTIPRFNDFAVDSFRQLIWAWNDQGLFRSTDGGATWGGVGVPAPPAKVDVAPMFTTIVLTNGTRVDLVSPTQGIPRPAPDLLTSVTAGPEFGMVAMSSTVDGVQVDPPLRVRKGKRLDVTPEDVTLSGLNLAQVEVDGKYVLYGFSPRALYRRSIPKDFNIPPPPRPVVTVKKRLPPPPSKPTLRPAGAVITLKPGEHRKVAYDLLLPPAPTPLDVYFMTDSTGSMQDAIAAVQESVQDIVDDLSAAGINLHFGVADFRDYPQTPAGDAATYPYKRRREVGPVDDDLADALEGITTGGGNGADSALEAIYQAVTGEGRAGLTADIPAGEGAEFRKDALKVVLVASDDTMREPDPTEPWNAGPSKETVIKALVEHDVEFVGIQVKTGTPSPRAQMVEIAEGAGSVAPAGGVDCDGDDEVDIEEGDALVCEFTSATESIAPAFINMLRGIKDLADVHVGVSGPRDVVRPLGKATFASVNVKAFNTLPVPVEYACTQAHYGKDTPVTIAGFLRGASLVSTTATVRCLAPQAPPPPVVEPVVPQPPKPPVAAAVAPPPPPAQPNPNVNPNPNPNPQAQGNAGFASQEEKQAQLALAENDVTENEELAFSPIDSTKDVTPAVTLVAGLLVACAAAGTQLHLARRTRLATNPSRGARR